MRFEFLFNIRYGLTNYEEAVNAIIEKAKNKENYAVSALAVHGLIEGYRSEELKKQINFIDLVVPDGQPIKWALNYFFDAKLKDRVYGPTLMLEVLKKAEKFQLGVFLYGSTKETLNKLGENIKLQFPNLIISGMQSDRFRESTKEEKELDRRTIMQSGAQLVFVGRGCPRQEKWVAENKNHIPAVLIAVGAAFDFHAKNIKQAPQWMQQTGLEWLYRLLMEPGRLWKRYLVTNTYFIILFVSKAFIKIIKR